MFSCSQNSRKPSIQNVINNYGGGGGGGCCPGGGGGLDLCTIQSDLSNLLYDVSNGLNPDQDPLTDENYVYNLYNNSDSFLSYLSLRNTIKLVKYDEGLIVNYYEPSNLFNSSRDSTHFYNNIDLYEKISYDNTLLYFNNKNILNNILFNNKNYKTQNTNQIISSYINNIYRGVFPSVLNLFTNDSQIKMIDNVIYQNIFKKNMNIYNYIKFLSCDSPNKEISFNEISKMGCYGLTPPYYFDLSGIGLNTDIYGNDISNSIYFNTNTKFHNFKLNLINFGGIEYEQNASLIQNILKDSSSNIIFYFYIQNNFDNFKNLFSNDFSSNQNNISNYTNFKKFILDNSSNINYNYGNLLFLIDNSNCKIQGNINNLPLPETSNNILPALNLNNVLICDYSDLSKNYNKINTYISSVNNITGITSYNDFSNVSLYNISNAPNKINNYNDLSNNNSLILCPLPQNNFNISNNTFVNDNNFKNNIYNYISLIQTLYKNTTNITYSTIISTNTSDTANTLFFDPSVNFMFSEKNLYLTYYDLPNYIGGNYNQQLLNTLDLTQNNRSLNNGRLGYTKIYYPFYYDNDTKFLNNISNYVKNSELTNYFYNYNANNIKNIFMKGYIQFILLYLLIYLFKKHNNDINNFTSLNIYKFYEKLINGNTDILTNNSDLSGSLYLLNNLFNSTIYIDVSSNILDYSYNLLKKKINLSQTNTILNTNLHNLICSNEILFAISSKILKLSKLNTTNQRSFYTLYDLNNIISKSGQILEENIYITSNTDISYAFLDDQIRYYLLNNWKQYYPEIPNYLF